LSKKQINVWHVSIIIAALCCIIFFMRSTSWGACNDRAITLINAGKYESALAECDKAIALNSNQAMAYSLKALAYERLKKFKEEIEECNKAIVIEPKNFKFYLSRATAYRELGQYQSALQDCNSALNLVFQKSLPYIHRGYIYTCLNHPQNAIADYTAALNIDPSSSQAYSLRADSYGKKGHYQKQIDDLTSAIKISPTDSTLYEQRGYAYLLLKKPLEATRDYTIAIQIHPESTYPHLLRADVYKELGQYQKQIADLSFVIDIDPQNTTLYGKRGYAYFQLGKFQKAIDDCTTSTRLDPASLDAYSTAALAYETLGLYSKAIEQRTKILKLKKTNSFDWSDRAKDYELLRIFDLAQADRRRAVELASPCELATMQLCSPLIDVKKLAGADSVEWYQYQFDKQLKGVSTVVPFHFDDEGHICVPAQINSRHLELMIDTGCSHTELWKQTMPGIAKVNNDQLRGTKANGEEYFFGFFRARDLKLGNLVLPNVAMAVDDGLVRHKTLSGFLGGNILENFVVTVDYLKRQTIIATSFKHDRSKELVTVPMLLRNHCPYCTVKLDGELEVLALLDTGCPSSMSPESLLQSILPKKLNYKHHVLGPWLGCLSTERVELKSLRIGAGNLKSPIFEVFPAVEAPTMASEIVLGNDFLSRFKTVTFDYPRRQVTFEFNKQEEPGWASSK